jgi:signal peptidase I
MSSRTNHQEAFTFHLQKRGPSTFVILITVALFSPVVLNSLFGTGLSPVLSDSMSPSFFAGDLLITGRAAVEQIAPGDVIVVQDDQSHVIFAHRVLTHEEVEGKFILKTAGDANPIADEKPVIVEAGVVLPKVLHRVPYAGTLLVYFSTTTGRALSVGLLFLAAILLLLKSLISRKHQPHKHQLRKTGNS